MDSSLLCPKCSNILTPDMAFCPRCGTQISTRVTESLSLGKQLGIFALSFFLPPLGLWPGIRYLKQNDPVAKRTGVLAIALTVISIILSLWFTAAIFNQYTATFQQYQNLGI